MTKYTPPSGRDEDRLDSWKKIAAYLGKGVRTAIRWSQDEGMPVYRHAGSKRGAVYAYRSEIDHWIHSNRSVSSHFYQKPVFIWFGAVFILILIISAARLWLNPETEQLRTVAGERPWVLITDFDNRSGEIRFDGIVETALRRGLANSSEVQVLAPERVRDILGLMRHSPDVAIDAGLGRQICLRIGGICALVSGRVEDFDSSYLFSLELVDPADGHTIASAEVAAVLDSEVLPAVHRLVDLLQEHLDEGRSGISTDVRQLEQVTTYSLHALELHSRGMQYMFDSKWAEAEILFRQAVQEDPEFASAYLFVFWTLNNQGKRSGDEAQSFLESAMELAGSVSEQERYFIEGTYYHFIDRNHIKSCGAFKTLADFYPDHSWATINAFSICGMDLGRREDYVRYAVQMAEERLETTVIAAAAITFLAGDFDRARPYVARLRGFIADGTIARWPGWARAWSVSFSEFFPAEEYLDKGMLKEVVSELQRIELTLGSMDVSMKPGMVRNLVHFYLALGQFEKAKAMGKEYYLQGMLQSWIAYLGSDRAVYEEYLEVFQTSLRQRLPDPVKRQQFILGWNMGSEGVPTGIPIDVLVPLYEPESALQLAASADESSRIFMSLPKLEAKLQLALGRKMLALGRPDEAAEILFSGIRWFRDKGDPGIFPYYFLGSELLALASIERGDLQTAYRDLENATGQRRLVSSYTAPLHQRIQARLALLSRELGRIAEAEAIEAELAQALSLADQDHPILVQIREQQALLIDPE